jgi:hypothetical protein
MDEPVKITLPIEDHLDKSVIAVIRGDGEPMGGKINPVTGLMDFYFRSGGLGGLFTLREVMVNYEDIHSLSGELIHNINYMTTRGFISGRYGVNERFDPHEYITRAEFSMALTRALSIYDPRHNGFFDDVTNNDWYFGAAGAVRIYRLITEFTDNMFEGDSTVSLYLALVMSVSALSSQMNYRFRMSDNAFHSQINVRNNDFLWVKSFIALAMRENLFDIPQNGIVNAHAPLTRSDAAMIIYRVFERIW